MAVRTVSAAPVARAPAPITVSTVPEVVVPAAPDTAVQTKPLSLAPAPVAAPSSAPATVPASAPASAAPSVSVAAPAAPAPVTMDRDFIARNQIVERYISGRLPIKGATEFERFCHDNPSMLDELGLPERVNAGLRLLEAAGKPEPWQEEPRKVWEKPQLVIGLGAGVLALLVALVMVWNGSSDKTRRIDALKKVVAEQPLEPASKTSTIRVLPSFQGSTNTPAVTVGGGGAQLADLKIDLSRSAYRGFRVTIDRVDQGRVAVLHNLLKDSNGHVRMALNTSALGPGLYQFTIEGLTWRGDPVPEAWLTIAVVH